LKFLTFEQRQLAFAVNWAPGGLGYRLYPAPAGLGWVPVALVVLGLLFTWWARLHLGVMWSGGIDRKEHHRIVDTGPYRLVRHPIYTGLILAIIATAAAARTPTVFAGVAVMGDLRRNSCATSSGARPMTPMPCASPCWCRSGRRLCSCAAGTPEHPSFPANRAASPRPRRIAGALTA
jgi:hypothetical protein